jgi:hypothetical protein
MSDFSVVQEDICYLSLDLTLIFARYCFAYAGYEDVRDFDGQWIRIEIKKGDLIVLPPGMYHRFTLDSAQYLKVGHLYSLLSTPPFKVC